MRQFFLKSQLFFWAVLLFGIFALVYRVISPFNYRWDLTREKVYSLPQATANALRDLKGRETEVLLFYSQDDKTRQELEVFLRECQRFHPGLRYDFYDPVRRPKIARKFNIEQLSTILIRSGEREERLTKPTEEGFTNAFLRLLRPQDINVCFVSGHGEAEINGTEPNGYQLFRQTLEGYNAIPHDIVLARDHVPSICQVVIIGGPRWELPPGEGEDLDKAFKEGKGLLYMIDPMDPGTGGVFTDFFKAYGVELGENVVVDKVSRIVGGDFLMPLVSQYFMKHPVTRSIKEASFFPLVRTVQPSTEAGSAFEVIPLAMTSEGSWAETDFVNLENGNATFDIKTDVAGPLPIAVAVERATDPGLQTADKKPKDEEQKSEDPGRNFQARNQTPQAMDRGPRTGGRMVVVGDSDFLSNGYLNLSGNKELGLSIIRWLGRDDRFIEVNRAELRFKPLVLDTAKRTHFLIAVLLGYPAAFFALGGLFLVIRSRTS